jgi:Tfp pilus assembly protein PilO
MRSLLEKKILITILVLISAVGIITGGIIYPTMKYIKELDAETYQLRVTMERKNEQVMSYRFAIKQLERIKATMPDFGQHLLYTGDELKLVTMLENLATEHGVVQRMSSADAGNVVNNRIQLSLTVQGEYNKVVEYLNTIEHLPYFATFNKVSMNPYRDKNSPDLNSVNMNLDISLYVISQ